ncbi:MAG: 3'-5' exonuclease [Pigmentiphaga sp.]|nr:3'-5' exonuclease [Pigmentiphaga sp.]
MIRLPWRRLPEDWTPRLAQLAESNRNAAPALRRFYEAGTIPADTPLAEVPLAALDLETTGLDPRQHAIVSIGLLPFRLVRIRCADSRYWVVKPDTGLADESVRFHHITHSEVAQAPPLSQVLAELLDAMAGRVMVVHYRRIECEFLAHAAQRLLGGRLEFPMIDTMELEARYHRRPAMATWRRLRGLAPASVRLADSRRRHGLPLYQAHHALTDALATAELLQAQVASQYSPDTAVSEVWIPPG